MTETNYRSRENAPRINAPGDTDNGAYKRDYNAKALIDKKKEILEKNRELIVELIKLHQSENEDRVSILVLDEDLLVVITDNGINVIAPVLECTHKAMTKIRDDSSSRSVITQSTSSPTELQNRVWEEVNNGNNVLSFDPEVDDPNDYLAMAGLGFFTNEPHHAPVSPEYFNYNKTSILKQSNF